MNLSRNAMTILQSSLIKSVSINFQFSILFFFRIYNKTKGYLDAAVKVEGDVKNIDHGRVISLLWEVVALLKGLVHDLKSIVKESSSGLVALLKN